MNILAAIQDLYFNRSSVLLATKMEMFKYKPGRLDLRLYFDPQRQTEFEKKWLALRKVRAGAIIQRKRAYDTELSRIADVYNADVSGLEHKFDRDLRVLVAEYGKISPEDPVLLPGGMARVLAVAGER